MPSKEEHLNKADGNAVLALSLILDSQSKIDWALVMLFYAALHYIEAYLADRKMHTRSHASRDGLVSRDSALKNIFRQYAELKYFGFNARYEVSRFKASDVTENAAKRYSEIKAYLQPLL